MTPDVPSVMESLVKAHAEADDEDIKALRALGPHERGILIERVCEAAAVIHRSRLAAGLPDATPAPWPPSTWDFLRKNAAHAQP
jgi:hypothetical protein